MHFQRIVTPSWTCFLQVEFRLFGAKSAKAMPDSKNGEVDSQQALSFMQEQRKQEEAGILILKRRLGNLQEKVVQRRDHIEDSTEDKWYNPDLVSGTKPKSKAHPTPGNTSRAFADSKTVTIQSHRTPSTARPNENGLFAPVRPNHLGVQMTQDRLSAILDSYDPRVHEVVKAPPFQQDIEEAPPGELKEKLEKARIQNVLKHSLSAQILSRRAEGELHGVTYHADRTPSVVLGFHKNSLNKSRQTQSTGDLVTLTSKPHKRNHHFKSAALRGGAVDHYKRVRTTNVENANRAVDDIQYTLEIEDEIRDDMVCSIAFFLS